MAAPEERALLSIEGLTKAYAGVTALDGAEFHVGRGEVHALVGENGAGKSTLIKILTGAVRRDAGTIRLDGRPVDFASPLEAQKGGVSTIYQELNLVPFRSVAENIFLGRAPRRFGLIDWRRMNGEAAALMRRLNLEIEVRQPLNTFNTSIQQMTALARAISFESRLVIMDEPTSSLDEREVETLFGVIRRLKAEGVSVVFITHRLDEIYTVCDALTVLRDGRTVTRSPVAEIGKMELVATMLGRKVEDVRRFGATAFAGRGESAGEVLVEAENLSDGGKLRGAGVTVRKGAIVGLAGLLGSGRSELAAALFGANPRAEGEIRLEGRPVTLSSPRAAIAQGIGFCSEDRKTEGIIPELSIRDNLTLAILPRLARAGIVDGRRQREIVDDFIRRLGIKAASPEQRIRELSGGNQQKVLLARWLCMNPRLLLLDEPTRGIDVGAKAEIQRLIRTLSESGLGVLLISSELEELTEGCDSVTVLREGRDVATLRHDEASEHRLMEAMAHGAEGDGPAASGATP